MINSASTPQLEGGPVAEGGVASSSSKAVAKARRLQSPAEVRLVAELLKVKPRGWTPGGVEAAARRLEVALAEFEEEPETPPLRPQFSLQAYKAQMAVSPVVPDEPETPPMNAKAKAIAKALAKGCRRPMPLSARPVIPLPIAEKTLRAVSGEILNKKLKAAKAAMMAVPVKAVPTANQVANYLERLADVDLETVPKANQVKAKDSASPPEGIRRLGLPIRPARVIHRVMAPILASPVTPVGVPQPFTPLSKAEMEMRARAMGVAQPFTPLSKAQMEMRAPEEEATDTNYSEVIRRASAWRTAKVMPCESVMPDDESF